MWPFTDVQPETALPWSAPASRLAGSGHCPRGFGRRITRLPARVGTPGHRRVRRDLLLSTLLDQPFWSHRLKARDFRSQNSDINYHILINHKLSSSRLVGWEAGWH